MKTLRNKHVWACLFSFLFLVGHVSFVNAAVNNLSEIPSVSNPGLIQKNLQKTFPVPQKPIPSRLIQEEQPVPSTSGFEKIQLTLNKVIFKGNTIFSDAELELIFKNSLHRKISLADLVKLVDAVTKLYRSQGYILSRAILPAQVIKNGVVTLQIIEGFISEVKVEGDAGFAKIILEKYGRQIKSMRPLRISYLERDMLLMNDLPGISEKAVIHPSKTVPGGAELLLVTERIQREIAASYDNYGTRYIGPQEMSIKGTVNSVTFPGSSDTIRYATVPHNTELNFIEFVHTNPIGTNGLRFSIGGNYTETHPLFLLSSLDVKSRGNYFFTDLMYPFLRTRTENLYFHSALNYQNITSTILGAPFYDDRTRSLVVGTAYNLADHWQGINNVSLDLEHGFKIMGAEPHVNQSRPLGVPNFSKGTLNLSRTQWLNQRFSLLGAIYGQYSFNPLLASEQYSYGGPDFGRGYDPSEIVGDDGLAGKIEFQMNTVPEWRWLNAIQYYIFYDAGIIWNRDGINLAAKQSATSAGVGARFNFIPQLVGNFYIAKPLSYPVAALKAMGENGNQYRAFFQLILTV